MFGLFKNEKISQSTDGPFGVTIGEQAIHSKIIKHAAVPYPYGPHGELFDDESMHSFYSLSYPPKFHELFLNFYGRYVNAYGKGRSTGLSRLIACSMDFDNSETSCTKEFFSFLRRLQSKYGHCEVIDKRNEVVDNDELTDKEIPEGLWKSLVDSKPLRAYTASWDLTNSGEQNVKKIDKIKLSLYIKSSFGRENIRYDKGYLALEYVFANDRKADEIYAEKLQYRGSRDDDML